MAATSALLDRNRLKRNKNGNRDHRHTNKRACGHDPRTQNLA
jgi:hypothetical protein